MAISLATDWLLMHFVFFIFLPFLLALRKSHQVREAYYHSSFQNVLIFSKYEHVEVLLKHQKLKGATGS